MGKFLIVEEGKLIITFNCSGGMRGIVELETLHAIEKAMDIQLPIQSFFDLIVGTRYVPIFGSVALAHYY
jgi:patatin-like phospholipase/acyl hydrolase